MAIPIPFVGAAVGVAVLSPLVFVGSTIGGVASGKLGGIVSSKIYEKNLETKCTFCQIHKKLWQKAIEYLYLDILYFYRIFVFMIEIDQNIIYLLLS